MIKLAIFDLDGTLLNTLDDLADACNVILERNGFPTHTLEAYRYFVGRGIRNLIINALQEEQVDASVIDDLLNQFIAYYSEHAELKTAPYPGIQALLHRLSEEKIALAVASNKFDAATQSLVSTYFKEHSFVSVFGQREAVPVKPDPQIVYDILRESGVEDRQEVIYIGDSGVDMQTAANAGLVSIGVLWGFRPMEELQEHGANYLVKSPEEILDIIASINDASTAG